MVRENKALIFNSSGKKTAKKIDLLNQKGFEKYF